eukprot:COSAG04_NODE_618_length_11896_cov_81.925659_15_plen_272_part_00
MSSGNLHVCANGEGAEGDDGDGGTSGGAGGREGRVAGPAEAGRARVAGWKQAAVGVSAAFVRLKCQKYLRGQGGNEGKGCEPGADAGRRRTRVCAAAGATGAGAGAGAGARAAGGVGRSAEGSGLGARAAAAATAFTTDFRSSTTLLSTASTLAFTPAEIPAALSPLLALLGRAVRAPRLRAGAMRDDRGPALTASRILSLSVARDRKANTSKPSVLNWNRESVLERAHLGVAPRRAACLRRNSHADCGRLAAFGGARVTPQRGDDGGCGA